MAAHPVLNEIGSDLTTTVSCRFVPEVYNNNVEAAAPPAEVNIHEANESEDEVETEAGAVEKKKKRVGFRDRKVR